LQVAQTAELCGEELHLPMVGFSSIECEDTLQKRVAKMSRTHRAAGFFDEVGTF